MSGTNGQFLFGAPVAVDGWDFTESTANDDTYCVEMENSTSGGNETGAGLGLTGTDLVATAGGTVAGVSSGYRQLTDGSFNFTDTFMNTWLPRDATRTTFSWAMLMKDVDRASDHAYFNWIGGTATARADAAIDVAHHPDANNIRVQHFAGNAYMPTSGTVQTMGFAPGTSTYVWLCHWLDGTAFRMGWTESATEHASPTAYSDFPSTQRFEAAVTAAANKNYWNYSPLYFYSYSNGGKGIGFNNGNAKGNFKLKKFVASKLPIAE